MPTARQIQRALDIEALIRDQVRAMVLRMDEPVDEMSALIVIATAYRELLVEHAKVRSQERIDFTYMAKAALFESLNGEQVDMDVLQRQVDAIFVKVFDRLSEIFDVARKGDIPTEKIVTTEEVRRGLEEMRS